MTQLKPGRLAAVICICLFWTVSVWTVPAFAAGPGAADTAGGYGWQVLEKVLPLWQPPAGGSGAVIVAVRVGSNGEILYCDTRASSGNPSVDMAACSTVAQAGSFAPPAGGVPLEVFLALPGTGGGQAQFPAQSPAPSPVPYAGNAGRTLQTAQPYPAGQSAVQPAPMQGSRAGEQVSPVGNYADIVMNQIRPHLRVPADFKGEATVVVHMRVDDRGRVVAAEVVEATDSTRSVDDAVLQAINRAGTMPPPPSASQRLVLTFTLRGL